MCWVMKPHRSPQPAQLAGGGGRRARDGEGPLGGRRLSWGASAAVAVAVERSGRGLVRRRLLLALRAVAGCRHCARHGTV